MRNFGFLLAAAAATTLTLAAAPAAFAADASVTWKGLDLTTDAGRAELDNRIAVAARAMCKIPATTGTIIERSGSRRCLADTREAIRAQLATKLPATALAAPSNPALASAAVSNSEAR